MSAPTLFALATTTLDGAPRVGWIYAMQHAEHLAFDTSAFPLGRAAIARSEVVLSAPFEGHELTTWLLDHPLVRGAKQVLLATRDAQALYAKFGFRDRREVPPQRDHVSTEMVLRR